MNITMGAMNFGLKSVLCLTGLVHGHAGSPSLNL
jgi:hypothetical protein